MNVNPFPSRRIHGQPTLEARLQPGQHAQHRRLPGPVSAANRNSFPGRNAQVRHRTDRPPALAYAKFSDVDHFELIAPIFATQVEHGEGD